MSSPSPDRDPLRDEHALRDLSEAYAAAVDDRDGEALASLFGDDGELVVRELPGDPRPKVRRLGPAELRRVPDGLQHYRHTFHAITTTRYVVGDDTATGRVWCIAHHVTANDEEGSTGDDVIWSIRYADAYRRTAEGWRFARRVLHLLWVEERPLVAVGPAPDWREDPLED
jgi:ketosteroid isomerase-like protein